MVDATIETVKKPSDLDNEEEETKKPSNDQDNSEEEECSSGGSNYVEEEPEFQECRFFDKLSYVVGTSTKATLPEPSQLWFLSIPNDSMLQSHMEGDQANSDLVSGVYEGGLKVWDCAFDLVDYVAANPSLFAGKTILEIGCGQGLPGVMALKVGANHVIFQDFNADVLDKATKPVIQANIAGVQESQYTLLPGSWEDLAQSQEMIGKVDIVIMSEVLYNLDYYKGLFDLSTASLRQQNLANAVQIIVATKTYYFGLGGGRFELQQFLDKNRAKYSLDMNVLQTVNDSQSIERMILGLHVAPRVSAEEAEDAASQMEETLENDFTLEF